MRGGLWLVAVCAFVGCSDPEWPPPPDNASATCVFEVQARPAESVAQSTLYFDANDRVFRVDGRNYDDHRNWEKATYYMEYDVQGRLVENRGPGVEETYTYDADEILAKGGGVDSTFVLAGGRVVSWQTSSWQIDYGYDPAGRLISYDSTGSYPVHEKFTYDAQDRVIEITRGSAPSYSLAYTETPDQLLISIAYNHEPFNEIRLDFDAQHRIIHSSVKEITVVETTPIARDATYLWGVDFIEETSARGTVRATGHCPAPTFVTSHPLPVPIQWGASYVGFDNQAALELRFLY